METDQTAVCCPVFDPSIWDGKTVVWQDKLFIKKITPQVLHLPLPGTIGKMMAESGKAIAAAQAKPADRDFLWLAYDPSPWKCEHYIHVAHEVPGCENVRLSGTFLTKVFDGPFNQVPKWIKEMGSYLAGQGKTTQKYYFYYTTCPQCAKKYGHNYVVAFAQL